MVNNLIVNIILILILIILIFVFYYMKSRIVDFFTNWDDTIDGIVYINLDNRRDRNKLILEELQKINTNMDKVNRVSAIYKPKNGHKGCVQSHILALNIARMNNWKNTLIFEDDIELIVSPEEFNTSLTNALDYMNQHDINWDVIMLATVNADKTNINKYLSKVTGATTSSGYIVNSKYYKTLLELFENCNKHMSSEKWSIGPRNEPYALDQQWLRLQKKGNWYAFTDDLIKQRQIRSTIMTGK